MIKNQFVTESKLNLEIQNVRGKNVLSDVFFTAPFKITTPFYEENFLKVMILNVSAGMMAGDSQTITIRCKEQAKTILTTQAYEKIHKMQEGGSAEREMSLHIESNSTVYYTPLPTIPFRDSSFRTTNNIFLEDESSQLFYTDILCCGRKSLGEYFIFQEYHSLLKIYMGKKIIYLDNTKYEKDDINPTYMFLNYSHILTIVLINFSNKIEDIENKMNIYENIEYGISTLEHSNSLCIKVLANDSEILLKLVNDIKVML